SRTDPIVFPGSSSLPGDRAVVADGLFLSVDLFGEGKSSVVYRARRSSALLELDRVKSYQVADYWDRIEPKDGRLILDAGAFYLLVSRDAVRLAPDSAATSG